MTTPFLARHRWLLPLTALLALAACAPSDLRDDMPGRAQGFPPIHTQTLRPGGTAPGADLSPQPTRRWSQVQAEQGRAGPGDQPPKRRRGSSSPPPDPSVLPQPPRPVPLPPVPSTQGATDAFKRDLIRPEVDRMRTDDAMGRLDPLGQRDLMRRENDLRQLGDPLAR
ncbi:hypothetical protein [Azospirillum agricola]|uniref:hypothetical protein n=1 Tax=Azospirillum agricola TaxID=1720247 RepID=UPI000A0F0408|nr:hypothetical protein [Azospirillum agricola]SMH52727.1 hypothetical protein SAMN02982994_3204 [Azospirillum lipoferum]